MRIRPAYTRNTILLVAMTSIAFCFVFLWKYHYAQNSFNQEQYDEGFLIAITQSATSSKGFIDFKEEFHSMQLGFDEGQAIFEQIIPRREQNQLPIYAPERLRAVIPLIRSTKLLDDLKKEQVLSELKTSLEKWKLIEQSNGQ